MGFDTTAKSGFVLTSVANGAWCLDEYDMLPIIVPEGPDRLRLRYFGRFDDGVVDPLFGTGYAPILYTGTGTWAVTDQSPRHLWGPFYEAEVGCVGIVGTKEKKVTWDVGVETTSGEDVYILGEGQKSRITARMPKVSCEVTWCQVGEPDTEAGYAGQARTPTAVYPPDPTNFWISLAEENQNFHYPYDWVSDGVSGEELVPTSDIWRCTEKFTYVFAVTP